MHGVHRQPGNTANWNNTYEQYIAREAWNAYKVHGGDRAVIERFARYAECDVKGQLAKYDGNGNHLIAYGAGALTGNDADAVALAFYGGPQDRTESAFWYSGAKAAAEAYRILGKDAKAAEMDAIAEEIKTAILTLLWDDQLEPDPGSSEVGRVPGKFGNAVRLGDVAQYVSLPNGVTSNLQRLHDLRLGQPGAGQHVVARVRLRHRHAGEHVPDRERRRDAAVRDHHERRRAPSSASTPRRRWPRTSGRTSRSR